MNGTLKQLQEDRDPSVEAEFSSRWKAEEKEQAAFEDLSHSAPPATAEELQDGWDPDGEFAAEIEAEWRGREDDDAYFRWLDR